MKTASLFLLFALWVSRAAFAQELTPDQRSQLLGRLAEVRVKFPSLQAEYSEEKTTRLLAKPLTSQGTVGFQAPDKFRREVKGANPSLTVSDGKTMSIYYPNFNEVELYTLGGRGFFNDSISALTTGMTFERVNEFYDVRAFRDSDLTRIELTPKRANLKRIVEKLTIWMDDELRGQRTEILLPKGDRVVTQYRNQSRKPLPVSSFVFTPPPGANVSRPMGK